MAVVLDQDLVDEVGDHRGPAFFRDQAEGQREDVRSLGLALIRVRLRVEEPRVEAGLDLFGQSPNRFASSAFPSSRAARATIRQLL